MPAHKHLISVAALAGNLERPDWRIVDCRFDLQDPGRGRRDYQRGHLPGAVYAHLDEDLAGPVTPQSGRHPLPEPDRFAATLRAWGISNPTQVVAYDGGPGAIAARLWWMLRWLGHERVAVLDGGYAAWAAAGQPVDKTGAAPPPGDFEPRERPGNVVSTAELASRLAQTGGEKLPLPLVDARESVRFAGREESIDPVAGHIPGAMNFPFAKNIADNGRWREPAELRAAWRELFGGEVAGEWAVMCGSGVTACHLALSAELAGLPEPRLYIGSWSEWIRDPGRPTAP